MLGDAWGMFKLRRNEFLSEIPVSKSQENAGLL